MEHLKLFVFGPPRLEHGAQPVELNLRKALALLVYLAVTGTPHTRDSLAVLLWPEASERDARANLRRTLYRLGQTPVGPYIIIDLDTITINLARPAGLWLDYAVFQQCLAHLQPDPPPAPADAQHYLTQAADLCANDFLAGFAVPDSPQFEEWQFFERESLRRQSAQVLDQLVQCYVSNQQWEPAISAARRRLVLDELHEPAHRALMELYALSCHPTAALRQYEECARILDAELGIRPDAATTELYTAIRTRRFPAQPESGTLTAPARLTALTGPPAASPHERITEEAHPPGHPTDGGHVPPVEPASEPGDAAPPPLRRLPLPLAGFIGRDQELRDIRQLLTTQRLVTLTGVGGAGKTRLALAVAAERAAHYADGIWLVELAGTSDPALVDETVARALGLHTEAGPAPRARLLHYLQSRTLLLILDNCEHLIAACAELAETLLTTCPGLRLLTTSREALRIWGEWVYVVPSLSMPNPAHQHDYYHIASYDAVHLFVARARAQQATFQLTPENMGSVVELCRRLDGIPLAIELAAARMRTLTLQEINARLSDSLRVLTSGSRTAPERQQTLRGALDWSYDLLAENERRLFRRLSVFVGGCDLEAVEWIGTEGDIAPDAIIDVLHRLVEQSLVPADTRSAPDQVRYRMLEPVRQYAQAHLFTADEAEAVYRRHAHFYYRMAQDAAPGLISETQGAWLERLEREHDNMRQALATLLEQGQFDAVVQMGWHLYWFWFIRGHLREGQNWIEQALAHGDALSLAGRAKALSITGSVVFHQCDFDTARQLLTEAEQSARAANAREPLAAALQTSGFVALSCRDIQRAKEALLESADRYHELNHSWGEGNSYFGLMHVAFATGDHAQSYQYLDEAERLQRQAGAPHGIATALFLRAMLAQLRGDDSQSLPWLRASLNLSHPLNDIASMSYRITSYAGALLMLGHSLEAARLFGLGDALRERSGIQVPYPSWHKLYDRHLAILRQQLDAAVLAAAWEAGRGMSLEQAFLLVQQATG